MDSPSAPTPPDPVATAQAQTTSNRETAITNANLNRYNQYGPQGSVEWDITGTNPDGSPRYQQRMQYSQGEQNVYDLGQQARQGMGQIAVDATGRLGNLLNQGFDPNQAVADNLYNLGSQRLAPRFDQQRQALEQRLANQGIGVDSNAYQRSMDQFGQTQNDAYNQLALTGQQQAYTQAMQSRAQPFNEITALMSGSQVASPMLGPQQQTQQANTDVAGIYNQGYQNQLGAFNAENSQNNAMMGGLFGLGGAAMRFLPWSDRRLKKDVVHIGTGPRGLNLYEWTYTFMPGRYQGVMADEAIKIVPEAVHLMSNGFYAVDYERLA